MKFNGFHLFTATIAGWIMGLSVNAVNEVDHPVNNYLHGSYVFDKDGCTYFMWKPHGSSSLDAVFFPDVSLPQCKLLGDDKWQSLTTPVPVLPPDASVP